jgi:hypothetical protein
VLSTRQTGETLLDETLKMMKQTEDAGEKMGVGTWLDLLSGACRFFPYLFYYFWFLFIPFAFPRFNFSAFNFWAARLFVLRSASMQVSRALPPAT